MNDLHVSGLVEDLIDWAEGEPDIEICALIVHPWPEPRGLAGKLVETVRRAGIYAALSKIAFNILERLEQRLLLRAGKRALLAPRFVGDRVPTHVVLNTQVSKSGFIHRFPPEDVRRVEALDADLLIRCGAGILQGGILSAARHGILSFHHGDNRINRGGPAGFWEVLERHACTGFVIQRLEAELDGGEVLYRGSFVTRIFYSWNQAALLERSSHYLKKVIRAVLEGRAEPEQRLLYHNRLYRAPLLHDTVRYAAKSLALAVRKGLRIGLGRRWRWGVSYAFGPWRSAVLWRAKTISSPAGHFLADPFAVREGASHFIFLEDFVYRDGKAVISVYRVDADKTCARLGTAIEEAFHLSFPFVFRFGGQYYMIPESADNRDIRLYRCVEFPLKWELHSIPMEDVSAVDTIVFEREGRWWMLTTLDASGCRANDSELHAFHSDNPLGGWVPHAGNPIVFDAAKGRNGGLLVDESGTYRVAQRPAFAAYGKGAAIYRIDELTERTYRESKVQDIDPSFAPGLAGTHHLHQDDGLVVFDHVRIAWTFRPS